MKSRAQIRADVLEMSIKDVLDTLKDGLDLANRSGDICATVSYANKINTLEEVVDGLVTVDAETDNLFTED